MSQSAREISIEGSSRGWSSYFGDSTAYDVAATKLCFSAFACNSILVSVMYRLENDHEKYQQGAGMWITDVTILMAVTAYLTMAMDYANTKKILNIMLLGFAASIVPHIFRRWRGKGRKEENL